MFSSLALGRAASQVLSSHTWLPHGTSQLWDGFVRSAKVVCIVKGDRCAPGGVTCWGYTATEEQSGLEFGLLSTRSRGV